MFIQTHTDEIYCCQQPTPPDETSRVIAVKDTGLKVGDLFDLLERVATPDIIWTFRKKCRVTEVRDNYDYDFEIMSS